MFGRRRKEKNKLAALPPRRQDQHLGKRTVLPGSVITTVPIYRGADSLPFGQGSVALAAWTGAHNGPWN